MEVAPVLFERVLVRFGVATLVPLLLPESLSSRNNGLPRLAMLPRLSQAFKFDEDEGSFSDARRFGAFFEVEVIDLSGVSKSLKETINQILNSNQIFFYLGLILVENRGFVSNDLLPRTSLWHQCDF